MYPQNDAMPLTDVIIRNTKPKSKQYKLSDKKGEIIESAKKLNSRARFAARVSHILTCVFDDLYNDVKPWAKEQTYRGVFLNDYQNYLARVLVMELCVIFDKFNERNKKYSIDALLCRMKAFQVNAALFNCPDSMSIAAECPGFYYLSREVVSGELTDNKIIDLLEKEKNAFLAIYDNNIKELKTLRDTYLAHPDNEARTNTSSFESLRKISEWCFAYCGLILSTLVASGGGQYDAEIKKIFANKVTQTYKPLFHELIKT